VLNYPLPPSAAPCPTGLQTSVQDYPGRTGLWRVGVPPSGPMDMLGHRLSNALVGNEESEATLEFGLTGEAPGPLQNASICFWRPCMLSGRRARCATKMCID
jgi:hypothetical protein